MQSAVLVGLALSASAVLAAPGQKSQSVANSVLSQAGVPSEYPLVFVFPGISVPLSIVGDARITSGGLYLTRSLRSQAGSAWFPERQPVSQGFVTTFEFLLTEQDSFRRYKGADGFAFVVQNDSATAIGNQGGAAAFAGGDGVTLPQIPGISRSLAIFFDTHKNADIDDPSGNYVAVCSTVGAHSDMQWPPRCLTHTHTD